jgi:hypothetical protein
MIRNIILITLITLALSDRVRPENEGFLKPNLDHPLLGSPENGDPEIQFQEPIFPFELREVRKLSEEDEEDEESDQSVDLESNSEVSEESEGNP